ncbi:MAG TPA: VanZ family protein [Burkholderiaceae bacterium]
MSKTPRHRSSTAPLALAYAALILYASLYPFDGWRWPTSPEAQHLLHLPWPRWFPTFDLVANLLGYLPMGALLYLAVVRSGGGRGSALALAVLAPSALSYAMEVTQQLLPARVSSLLDWVLNSAGALLGALLAMLLERLGAIAHWQSVRERWFVARSAGAISLLLLWPLGLLFPAPVPLGLGQVLPRLRELAEAATEDTPWAAWVDEWLATAAWPAAPLSPLAEWLVVTLGLLAPCLLAFSVLRSAGLRLVAAALIAALGFAVTALSTALNFGPQHALAWIAPVTLPALLSALALAGGLAFAPRRAAAAVGLVVLTALVALVTQAPSDAYYASTLQAWEQGRFIRFHGLSRWIGWLWPYAALGVLLWRVASNEGQPKIAE